MIKASSQPRDEALFVWDFNQKHAKTDKNEFVEF